MTPAIRGDAGKSVGAGVGGQRQRAVVEERYRRERVRARGPLEGGRDGKRVERDRSLRRGGVHAEAEHTIGVGIGERPEQHGAHDGEDRGGRADAERHGQQGDRRERGAAR
jgi:hypothetical protein